MALVMIQAEGQMTIPQSVREALGIKAGTQLVCIQTGPDVFECHMLPQPMGLRAYLDTHSFEGPEITQEDIDAAVDEGMRAEMEKEMGDVDRVTAAVWARGATDALAGGEEAARGPRGEGPLSAHPDQAG